MVEEGLELSVHFITSEQTWHDAVHVEKENGNANGNGKSGENRRHEHLEGNEQKISIVGGLWVFAFAPPHPIPIPR